MYVAYEYSIFPCFSAKGSDNISITFSAASRSVCLSSIKYDQYFVVGVYKADASEPAWPVCKYAAISDDSNIWYNVGPWPYRNKKMHEKQLTLFRNVGVKVEMRQLVVLNVRERNPIKSCYTSGFQAKIAAPYVRAFCLRISIADMSLMD